MKTNSMYADIVLCLTVDGKHQTQVKAAVKYIKLTLSFLSQHASNIV